MQKSGSFFFFFGVWAAGGQLRLSGRAFTERMNTMCLVSTRYLPPCISCFRRFISEVMSAELTSTRKEFAGFVSVPRKQPDSTFELLPVFRDGFRRGVTNKHTFEELENFDTFD